MTTVPRLPGPRAALCSLLLTGVAVTLASCSVGNSPGPGPGHTVAPVASPATTGSPAKTATAPPGSSSLGSALPVPAALAPFSGSSVPGAGGWRPAGRLVNGVPAVYETELVPPGGTPGGTQAAGIAWMDASMLSARLYSGSSSPGGGPYRYTAPIEPAQAASLVAAFNGGFKMNAAGGGYYAEGRVIDPLRMGAASLVIYADGSVNVGAWGTDVRMTSRVVSVRQNLAPLVADGRPTPKAASSHWGIWGSTCGAISCAASVPGIEHQWRSGLGVTADGALVYVAGPALDPLQLAQLLVRAGVVRGMQLDINPNWPVFVSYAPPGGDGLAAPSNGSKLVSSTTQGPGTFFESSWARDFITMSARPSG